MSWDAIGAIAAVITLSYMVFMDWPKFNGRVKNIFTITLSKISKFIENIKGEGEKENSTVKYNSPAIAIAIFIFIMVLAIIIVTLVYQYIMTYVI